jgi:hypothetical protein
MVGLLPTDPIRSPQCPRLRAEFRGTARQLADSQQNQAHGCQRSSRARGLLLRADMLISRCAWHSRNYGRTKLLGVSDWRGRGIRFTDGLCRRCAERIHPAVRPLVVRETGGPKHGWLMVAGLVLAIMTALVLVARPTSDVPLRESRSHQIDPPRVREAAPPRETLPHRPASKRLLRADRVAQATRSGSPTSSGRASRAPASHPTEAPRTEPDVHQSP